MAIYKSINSKKALSTHGAMRNCLQYVLNPKKTGEEHSFIIGTYEGNTMDYDNIYRAFLDVKKQYDADSGRQYAHSVISFHKDEKITREQALNFAIDFAEKAYSGHQVAIAVHSDRDHIHCHMVVNTVSYLDGSKIHKSKDNLQADKDYCNELCSNYGLSLAEKGKHFDGSDIEAGEIISWNKDTYRLLTDSKKDSFLADCGLAVIHAIEKSASKEAFISSMKAQGWSVEWSDKRKHITFINSDGKKIRGKSLLKSFGINATKDGLSYEFERARTATERAESCESKTIGAAGARKSSDERHNKEPRKANRI